MKDSPECIKSFPDTEHFDPASAVLQLLDTVEQLKVAIEERDKEIEILKTKVGELETGTTGEFNGIYISLMKHRERLEALEGEHKPTKLEMSRADKIREYLKKAKTHSAPYETLKGHLNLSSQALLSTAIKTLMEEYPGEYSKKVSETDARKNILIWHPESKRRLAGKIL